LYLHMKTISCLRIFIKRIIFFPLFMVQGERIHMDVANLYADVSDGVAVCSTRLKPSYQKIKQNKIYIYNLLSKKLSEHDITTR
jgi:hypothetical protein